MTRTIGLRFISLGYRLTYMNVDYNVQIWKEGDQFVAHATPIDVASSGKTPEEAKTTLDEAVHLFLITALEVGTLQQVLEEAGYEREDDHWLSPSCVIVERRSSVVTA